MQEIGGRPIHIRTTPALRLPRVAHRCRIQTVENQPELVWRSVANCKRLGAAIYAGKNFAVASFEDGKRIEIRVDRVEKNPNDLFHASR